MHEWKVPFNAWIPSFLYEQEGKFLRFKECRDVRIPRSYLVQLGLHSFRSLARGPDQFSSTVHHCVFLFVGVPQVDDNGDVVRRKKVRAFKLGRDMVLKEETDAGIVCTAWKEFQKSPAGKHTVDLAEDFVEEARNQQGNSVVCEMRRDLKTRVAVQTWGALSYYKADATGDPCDDDEYAGLRNRFGVPYTSGLFVPWGSVHGGRLCFQHACNMAAGCVEIPLLMPSSEVFDAVAVQELRHSRQDDGQGVAKRVSAACSEAAAAAEEEDRMPAMGTPANPTGRLPPLPEIASDICPVTESIRQNPIMPVGWYMKNLIGARVFCIEYYKHKSVLVLEMLDGKLYRFKECCPDRPISKRERKGCIWPWRSNGWATQAGQDDDECIEEEEEEEDKNVDESIHDDCVSSPALALAQVLRWKAELFNIERVQSLI